MENFLSLNECSLEELIELLELSRLLKAKDKSLTLERELEGQTLAMVFEKSSLRTRMSFQIAMADLGGVGIYLKPEDIGRLGEREPIKDSGRVLGRYVHGIMARVYKHQSLIELAKYTDVPVINALSDWTHPCQAMADMLTIKEHLGELSGKSLAFIGDGNNVARSLAFACGHFGLTMTVASPAGFELDDASIAIANSLGAGNVTQLSDPKKAVAGVDVIYTDTWVSMGQEEEMQQRIAAFDGFQVNDELVSLSNNAKIMHCLPAHRGQEITDEVMESANSVIFDEAENRLHFQRALLFKLLSR